MGERASRSGMGTSRPRLFRASETPTTPAREGEFRKASAHAWEGREERERGEREEREERRGKCVGMGKQKSRIVREEERKRESVWIRRETERNETECDRETGRRIERRKWK